MAWVGIVVLGLVAEVSLIITLGRRTTRRDEDGRTPPRDLLGPRQGTTAREDGEARPALPSPRLPADGARAPTPRPRPGRH